MLTCTPARGGSNYSTVNNDILHNILHNTVHNPGPPLPAQHTPARVASTQLGAEQVGLPSCVSQFLHPVRILSESMSVELLGSISHVMLRLWSWFVAVDVDRSGNISASELRKSCFDHSIVVS